MLQKAEGRPRLTTWRPSKSVITINGMRLVRVMGSDYKPRVAISTGAGGDAIPQSIR
jgi:hypothetical protein